MTIRLHDSLTKRAEPVAPDRPIGIYSCGPTVYDRIHVGNARPFVVAMVLKRHLDRQGVPSKVVINVTDVNDKIYDRGARARRPEHGARRRDDRRVLRRHRPARPGTARRRAAGDRDDARDRRADRAPDRERPRLRGERRRVLRRQELPVVRRPVGAEARRDAGRGTRRARRGQALSARLRAVEGDQARRGRVVGLAVGERAARLAHRVLGDGDGAPRRADRRARRRPRPDLPAPRERARAVRGRDRSPVRGHLAAQRHAAVRRREDVEVARQRRAAGRRARRVGRRDAAAAVRAGPLPQPDGLQRRHARAGARRGRGAARGDPQAALGDGRRIAGSRAAATRPTGGRPPSTPRWTTTWRRRRRWPSCSGSARPRPGRSRRRPSPAAPGPPSPTRWCRGSTCSGWPGLGTDDVVPAEIVGLAEERRAARAARDFARSDALRDQIAAAGYVVRDVADGFELVPAPR